MTPEEYEWYLNLIKERHQYLNLTSEQAQQIYDYEKDKNLYSKKHYLSTWEEWDYESFTFKKILSEQQFKDYLVNLSDDIKRYEQSLLDQDNQKANTVNYRQEILSYYATVFLPDLFKEPKITAMPNMYGVKEKITFLKSEYKLFLNDDKKKLLIECFRHSRSFAPNEVRIGLLMHKISYLWPDYGYFKHSADEATKGVMAYVRAKVRNLPDEVESLLAKKITDLNDFNKALSKKYYGEPKGWHVHFGELSSEEEKEERIMQLFLLDADYYGLALNNID